jgi:hypothetical protein
LLKFLHNKKYGKTHVRRCSLAITAYDQRHDADIDVNYTDLTKLTVVTPYLMWLATISHRRDPSSMIGSPYETCGVKSDTGTGSCPRTSVFPCQYHSTDDLYSYNSRGQLEE